MWPLSKTLVIFTQKSGHRTFTWAAGQLPCYAVWSWKRTPIRHWLLSTFHQYETGFSFWPFWTPNTLMWERQDVDHQLMLSVTTHGFHLRQTLSATKTRGLLMMHVATNRPRQRCPKVLEYFCLGVQIHTYISQLTILHVARHRESKSLHVDFQCCTMYTLNKLE